MKKIVERVATVALICITFVFMLLAVLYATNVIPQKEASDNAVAIVVLAVLAAIYVALSIYLLIINFSEGVNVKRILLFHEADSVTRASAKVVNNIIHGCAKEFPQLKIRRTIFRPDDKNGLTATVSLEAKVAEDISAYIPKLKNLLIQSLQDSLGLHLNAINFDVMKLAQKYTPTDTEIAAAEQTPAYETEQTETNDATAEEPQTATEQPSEQTAEETAEQPSDESSKQDDILAGEEKNTADA